MNTSSNLWPQETPGNHTVAFKINVEIQILYLKCQWKPHKSIIFLKYDTNKYDKFWHKMHRDQGIKGVQWAIQSGVSGIEFIYICSTSVILLEGTRKFVLWYKIIHRNLLEILSS